MITLIILLAVIFWEHPKGRKGMGRREVTVLLKCLASVTAAQNTNDRPLDLMSLEEIKYI